MTIKIEKYKPKYHHNPDICFENCEKDCDMECESCRASPFDTNFYWIIQTNNESFQLCENCWKELMKIIGEIK